MNNQVINDPILFCFCGPTASGKTTICEQLLEKEPKLFLSVSSTTRAPRKGEVNGVHYHFITKQEFEASIKNNEFLEYAKFNDNFYGTKKSNIDDAKRLGKDLLLDIEVQGVAQLKKNFDRNVVTVFVFPVSFAEMKKRLENRATESKESIAKRLSIAEKEVAILSADGFSDYLLINAEVSTSVQSAQTIVRAERLRFPRNATRIIS